MSIENETARTETQIAESSNFSDHKACPECGSRNVLFDSDTGEHICGGCGLVVELEAYDMNKPDERIFGLEEQRTKSRTSPANPRMHDGGISTVITGNKDAFGRKLTGEQMASVWRLRKWNQRTKLTGSKNRNLSIALTVISRASDNLKLPGYIVDEGRKIYKQALENGYVRGRTIDGVAAACLYASSRINTGNNPAVKRDIVAVAKAANVDKSTLKDNYRFLHKELKLRPTIPTLVSSLPTAFGKMKFAENAPIRNVANNLAIYIQNKRDENKKRKRVGNPESGRGPSGNAAALIYIASLMCGEHMTQDDIAKNIGVTSVTIRNRYKDLMNYLDLERTNLSDFGEFYHYALSMEREGNPAALKDIARYYELSSEDKPKFYMDKMEELGIIIRDKQTGRDSDVYLTRK